MIAVNLERLLDADEVRRGARLTHAALAKRARVGQGTIGRMTRGENGPGVDTLEAVALVFGCRAWQLLIPDLDPAAKPQLMTAGVRQELDELRAMRRNLEELARGRAGPQLQSTGDGDTGALSNQREQQGPGKTRSG